MPKKIPKIYFFYSFHTKNRTGIFNPPPIRDKGKKKHSSEVRIREKGKENQDGDILMLLCQVLSSYQHFRIKIFF